MTEEPLGCVPWIKKGRIHQMTNTSTFLMEINENAVGELYWKEVCLVWGGRIILAVFANNYHNVEDGSNFMFPRCEASPERSFLRELHLRVISGTELMWMCFFVGASIRLFVVTNSSLVIAETLNAHDLYVDAKIQTELSLQI